MPRWTRIREPAMQFWPAKVVTPAVRSGRVEASIASSNTIIGVLPPSSRFMRFSVLAPAAAISRPTSILPVKLTMSTSADSTRNGAPVLPDSVNILTTPAGIDRAWETTSAISALVSAVCPGSLAACVPRRHLVGVGPCLKHLFARRFDDAGDQDLLIGGRHMRRVIHAVLLFCADVSRVGPFGPPTSPFATASTPPPRRAGRPAAGSAATEPPGCARSIQRARAP